MIAIRLSYLMWRSWVGYSDIGIRFWVTSFGQDSVPDIGIGFSVISFGKDSVPDIGIRC